MASNYMDESDETFDFLCNSCHGEGSVKKAVEFCMLCCEYYCAACLKYHSTLKVLKGHRKSLLGDVFKDLTKTRLQPASAVPYSSNDVPFACHSCQGDGNYKIAVDFCKECLEYLCDVCLKGHNKWTKHSDKLMGKDVIGNMIDARKTNLSHTSRSTRAPTPPGPLPGTGNKTHGEVSGRKLTTQPVPSPRTVKKDSREVGGAEAPRRSVVPKQPSEQLVAPKQLPKQLVAPKQPSNQSAGYGARLTTQPVPSPRTVKKDSREVGGAEAPRRSVVPKQPSEQLVAPKQLPKQLVAPKQPSNQSAGYGARPRQMISSVDRTEKIEIRHHGDDKECWVWGLCSLPDGGWIIADNNNAVIKRLDNSGSVTDRYPVSGVDVCYITEQNVAAVATRDANTIKLISLDAKMQRLRTIKTNHECGGVTYNTDKFYVTSGGPAIYEHDYKDGRLLREICPRDSRGEKRFSRTQYITSSEDGSRLFITDRDNYALFILDTTTASLIHQVSVSVPEGVCLGEDDDLFVASFDGIIHLYRNGTKLSTVITRKMLDGRSPRCVSYDKRTARLAVTVDWCDYMFVFHMK